MFCQFRTNLILIHDSAALNNMLISEIALKNIVLRTMDYLSKKVCTVSSIKAFVKNKKLAWFVCQVLLI